MLYLIIICVCAYVPLLAGSAVLHTAANKSDKIKDQYVVVLKENSNLDFHIQQLSNTYRSSGGVTKLKAYTHLINYGFIGYRAMLSAEALKTVLASADTKYVAEDQRVL